MCDGFTITILDMGRRSRCDDLTQCLKHEYGIREEEHLVEEYDIVLVVVLLCRFLFRHSLRLTWR